MKERQSVLKTVTVLGFIAVAFLVSSMLASQASAQQYIHLNQAIVIFRAHVPL